MKSLYAMLAASLIAIAPAFAEEMPTSPAAAKDAWQQMTPEQQAAKTHAKSTAQGKQDAWRQMGPEDKQAKREAMRGRMQGRMGQRH